MKGVVFLMKKLFVFICLVALISFAAVAFADSGGHVNPSADINLKPVADYTPKADDVTATGGKAVLGDPVKETPANFKAADIYLPGTGTVDKVAVMVSVKVNVEDYKDGVPVTINFANYTDVNTTELFAFIMAKKDSGSSKKYTKNKFYSFECKVTDKVLSFTVDEPEAFFTENTVVLATAKTTPKDSSGGGGGCNASYAGLLLFATVPFFFRKKK